MSIIKLQIQSTTELSLSGLDSTARKLELKYKDTVGERTY